MTDILLIGSFHFRESNIDFSSDDVQRQLDDLAKNISRFMPDAVAVEIDKEKYGAMVTIADGEWKKQMSNESWHLGGRIAAFSKLQFIHPIDKIFPLNSALISTENMELIKPRIEYLERADTAEELDKRFLNLNSVEYAVQDANIYLDINSQNSNGDYFMSRCLSDWYFRNLCIFSNIQALSKKYNRIVILYGAGHIPILKDLVNTCDSMNLVDANLYL